MSDLGTLEKKGPLPSDPSCRQLKNVWYEIRPGESRLEFPQSIGIP
jgi:hypothetical protein